MPVIGLVSDTHGLLRPELLAAMRGCDAILHAGDIGAPGIVPALAAVAPVVAIRGNVDTADWARRFPETAVMEVAPGVRVYMLHDVNALDIDPAASGFRIVLYGHSHRPDIRSKDGVLYVNPGSAGPRRFSLPIAAARLLVDAGALRVEPVDLTARSAA